MRIALTCLLVLFPGVASAYVEAATEGGIPLHWNSAPSFRADESLDEVSGSPEVSRAVLSDAVAAWRGIPGAGLEGMRASSSRGSVPGYDADRPEENYSEVFAARALPGETPDALAVTLVTYDSASGRIFDADVIVRSRDVDFAVDGDPRRFDLASVVTHEIGHALGLNHEPIQDDATMYAETPVGETSKRTISADDEAGILAAYGAVAMPVPASCAAAPGRASAFAFLFALVVLGLVARRTRIASILLFATFASLPVGAAEGVPIGFLAHAASADVLVVGRVADVRSQWAGRWVETQVRIETARGVEVVHTIGGEAGGIGTWVAGSARFERDTRVAVLAKRTSRGLVPVAGERSVAGIDDGPSEDDVRRAVSWMQSGGGNR